MPRALILAALLLAGCGDEPRIVGNAAPDGRCAYSDDDRIERGTLDFALRDEYRLAAVFASSSPVDVVGAEVRLREESGLTLGTSGLPNPFVIPVAAHVPAHRRAVGGIAIIPGLYGMAIASRPLPLAVRVEVIAFGADGEEFEPFDYIVDVCDRCLVACTSDPIDEVACEPGQDFPVPVSVGTPLCP